MEIQTAALPTPTIASGADARPDAAAHAGPATAADAPPTQPARRTGGRSALVLSAVRSAVEELVKERGAERVTVPMIAERAGVNPTSIYRRWGDLPTLLNEIATYHLDPNRPLPTSGDLRADLTAWAREIVEHYSKPVNAALLRAGAATAGDAESDCLRDRRAEASMIVERAERALASAAGGSEGQGTAEHGAPPHVTAEQVAATQVTAEQVIDHLVAPIIYRVIFLPSSVDATTADRLIADLFDRA